MLNEKTKNAARAHNNEFEQFVTRARLKLGCILNPLLFTVMINDTIIETNKKMTSLKLGSWRMKELMFPDSEQKLLYNLNILKDKLEKWIRRSTHAKRR